MKRKFQETTPVAVSRENTFVRKNSQRPALRLARQKPVVRRISSCQTHLPTVGEQQRVKKVLQLIYFTVFDDEITNYPKDFRLF